jgi:hypothetical protein
MYLYNCNWKICTKEATMEIYEGQIDEIKMESIEVKS